MQESGFDKRKEFSYALALTLAEASCDTAKVIILTNGQQTRRVILKVPPQVKDGTLIRIPGQVLGRMGSTLYAQLPIVE